jgi:hypothetical protein
MLGEGIGNVTSAGPGQYALLLVTAGLHCPLVGSTGEPLAPLNSFGKYELTSGLLCGNSLTAKKVSVRSFMIVLPLKKVSIIISLPPRILHPD